MYASHNRQLREHETKRKGAFMKTVSWQSVAIFIGALAAFVVTAVFAPSYVTAFAGVLATTGAWLVQGPRSRITGQSLFPPKDGTVSQVTGSRSPPALLLRDDVPQLVKNPPQGFRGSAESIAEAEAYEVKK